jgi:hypothetical protein
MYYRNTVHGFPLCKIIIITAWWWTNENPANVHNWHIYDEKVICSINSLVHEYHKNFLQDGAHYLHVKQSDFSVINPGQNSTVALIKLKSLINPQAKTVGNVQFFFSFWGFLLLLLFWCIKFLHVKIPQWCTHWFWFCVSLPLDCVNIN